MIGDIITAYKATNLNLTGAGETIAIVMDDYPNDSDLTNFWIANNINRAVGGILSGPSPNAVR